MPLRCHSQKTERVRDGFREGHLMDAWWAKTNCMHAAKVTTNNTYQSLQSRLERGRSHQGEEERPDGAKIRDPSHFHHDCCRKGKNINGISRLTRTEDEEETTQKCVEFVKNGERGRTTALSSFSSQARTELQIFSPLSKWTC